MGAVADFVVLDLDRLERDVIMAVDPRQLLFALRRVGVVADGRMIVREGNISIWSQGQ